LWRVTVTVPNDVVKTYTVFVAAEYPTAKLPVKDVRVAASVGVTNQGWRGELVVTADREVVDVVNPQATVTVKPSMKIVAPYGLSIYDDQGKRLAYCSGAACKESLSVKVAPKDLTSRVYTAFVAQEWATSRTPVKDVRTTGSVSVADGGWVGHLFVESDQLSLGVYEESAQVRVTPTQPVLAPYVLSLYTQDGKRLWVCGEAACRAGAVVDVPVMPGSGESLVGFVATEAPASGHPAPDTVVASFGQGVSRDAWSGEVTLEAKYIEPVTFPFFVDWRVELTARFDPPLPGDASPALYNKAGKRVAVWTGWPGSTARATLSTTFGLSDEVYTLVVGGDPPTEGFPDVVWGQASVMVSAREADPPVEVSLSLVSRETAKTGVTTAVLHYELSKPLPAQPA
jgi:hypothetical protein